MALNRMSDLVSSAGEALGLTADPLYTTLAAKVGQTLCGWHCPLDIAKVKDYRFLNIKYLICKKTILSGWTPSDETILILRIESSPNY